MRRVACSEHALTFDAAPSEARPAAAPAPAPPPCALQLRPLQMPDMGMGVNEDGIFARQWAAKIRLDLGM